MVLFQHIMADLSIHYAKNLGNFYEYSLLPVLIVLSAIFKPSIWSLITMMCLFFWVGPVKTVRSMALQIKEETYVETAKALGASMVE